jgi:hypothetical protein
MAAAAKLFLAFAAGVIHAITSDKKELNQRIRQAERNMHVPQQIISKLGGDLVFDAGAMRIEGWACPECGARSHTDTGAAVIKQNPGNYPSSPSSYECTACEHYIGTISKVVDILCPEWRAQLKLYRETRGTDPVQEFWTIAAYNDTIKCARWTETAIRSVLPTQHDCKVQLVKVRAVDESQVVKMMQDLTLLEHMVTVEIDQQGRPLVRWCGDNDAWGLEDSGELHQAQFDRRVVVEREIDDELAQLKAQRLQAAGL